MGEQDYAGIDVQAEPAQERDALTDLAAIALIDDENVGRGIEANPARLKFARGARRGLEQLGRRHDALLVHRGHGRVFAGKRE